MAALVLVACGTPHQEPPPPRDDIAFHLVEVHRSLPELEAWAPRIEVRGDGVYEVQRPGHETRVAAPQTAAAIRRVTGPSGLRLAVYNRLEHTSEVWRLLGAAFDADVRPVRLMLAHERHPGYVELYPAPPPATDADASLELGVAVTAQGVRVFASGGSLGRGCRQLQRWGERAPTLRTDEAFGLGWCLARVQEEFPEESVVRFHFADDVPFARAARLLVIAQGDDERELFGDLTWDRTPPEDAGPLPEDLDDEPVEHYAGPASRGGRGARPRVLVGPPSWHEGVTLDPMMIRRALRARTSSMERCYHRERMINPTLERARLVVEIRIDTAGRVVDASVPGADPAWSMVARCTGNLARSLRLEVTPYEPTTYRIPVLFYLED